MRLLVAEDEPKIGIYLQQGLTEAGFNVDRFTNGQDALQHALSEAYDLLILDVMMPGLDGWEVLRMVRAAGKEVPVLFLTARDGVDDRVKGLELGADDYLVKPFAFSELLARVRTLLRRGSSVSAQTTMQMADLEVDLLKRRYAVFEGGQMAVHKYHTSSRRQKPSEFLDAAFSGIGGAVPGWTARLTSTLR